MFDTRPLHSLNYEGDDGQHRKVVGLQNLDSESEAYRPYKQLIERFNQTFKHHVKPSHGFNSVHGALALVTLFVTRCNFLRPHKSLNYRVPIELTELEGITTLQGKWAKVLSLAG
jgi:putative transposase